MINIYELWQDLKSSFLLLFIFISFLGIYYLYFKIYTKLINIIFNKKFILEKGKNCIEKLKNIQKIIKELNKLENRNNLVSLIKNINNSFKFSKEKYFVSFAEISKKIQELLFGNNLPYVGLENKSKKIIAFRPKNNFSKTLNGHLTFIKNQINYFYYFYLNRKEFKRKILPHIKFIEYSFFYIEILENGYISKINFHHQEIKKIELRLLKKQNKVKFIFSLIEIKFKILKKQLFLFLKKSIFKKLFLLL
ncbi:hypothetical protein [Paulownia witches'-broom phytoplasma]|uniref:hypothetical protein n=1 Tax=Paulownia witches'-broom phytoplasma TaxID=39647 RepID=UPI002D1F6E6B|nr:hypothetical protein PAWBP_7650 [Paulownia witches'-broom phytoplasma]